MTHAPDIEQQAEALVSRGDIAAAMDLLHQGVAAGNGIAALVLADWRMSGAVIRRDLAEARDHYGVAAHLGIEPALATHIALLATGAGGTERRWPQALALLAKQAASDQHAARQTDLITRMKIDAAGNPLDAPEVDPVHQIPQVERIPGFLTAEEAQYLIDLAVPLLQPAMVVHPQNGAFVRDTIRTATAAAFPFVREDPVLHAINRRIAAATGTSYEQGEPLQVLSYVPGQEYKLHSDALPPGHNQRRQTFLVTLSNGFDGGETVFPRLGLALRGAVGDALHFHNVDSSGRPDALAWHAGAPVTKGRKLLLSKWIREAPLDLSGPPGRPF